MTGNPQILFICSANVCRSQRAKLFANRQLASGNYSGLQEIRLAIESAGVHAVSGEPSCDFMCRDFLEFVDKASEPFTTDLVTNQTLIFVMEQKLQAEVVKQAPSVRQQVYMLKMAAAIAKKIESGIADLSLFSHESDEVIDGFQSPPLPDRPNERWSWIMQEMDAQRSLLPNLGEKLSENRFDIQDSHGSSEDFHASTRDLVDESVGMLMEALEMILRAPTLSLRKIGIEGLM